MCPGSCVEVSCGSCALLCLVGPRAELGLAGWMDDKLIFPLAVSPASRLSLYKFILYLIYLFYFVPFFFI